MDDGGSTADATSQVLIFGAVSGGNFVIGDKNADVGSSVTFWGGPMVHAEHPQRWARSVDPG